MHSVGHSGIGTKLASFVNLLNCVNACDWSYNVYRLIVTRSLQWSVMNRHGSRSGLVSKLPVFVSGFSIHALVCLHLLTLIDTLTHFRIVFIFYHLLIITGNIWSWSPANFFRTMKFMF